MEVAAKKGTVTPLASLFTPEDAEKAARRVQETLAEKQADLDRVQGFISDNTSLMNLVQRLPNDLHHDIMVPFGKAAFFPGRLIHTNEFLVLLGEGYYAERTSKQTAEILYRRDQGLASQAESLKAIMHDLKAEASFFVDTASEAAEGLVEITEDYVEENSSERESQSGPPKEDAPRFSEADDTKVGVKDEEYARMMSRLDELEKEELEAEYGNGSNEVNAKVGDEDEDYARMMSRLDELEKEELEAECGNGRDDDNAKVAVDDEEYTRIISRLDELEKEEPEAEHDNETDEEEKIKADFDQLWNQRSLDNNLRYSEVPVQTSKPRLDRHKDFTGSIIEHTHGLKTNSSQQTVTSSQVPVQTSKPGFDSHKAFPGSIIEHTNITGTNLSQQSATSSQSPSSQPSKPISRFKMQRR